MTRSVSSIRAHVDRPAVASGHSAGPVSGAWRGTANHEPVRRQLAAACFGRNNPHDEHGTDDRYENRDEYSEQRSTGTQPAPKRSNDNVDHRCQGEQAHRRENQHFAPRQR